MSSTPENQKETWKPIPNHLGYEVSDCGRVRSFLKRGKHYSWVVDSTPQRVLKASIDRAGRQVLVLCNNGKRHRWKVASLVLLAFVGSKPEGMETCHNNGNPCDDRLENLRYDTHLGNMRDIRKHGRATGKSPIPENDIIKMRRLRAEGAQYDKIGQEHRCSASYAKAICQGRVYRHCGGPLAPKARLGREKAMEIRHRYRSGETQQSLADEFGVHYSTVSLICSNKRWIETDAGQHYSTKPLLLHTNPSDRGREAFSYNESHANSEKEVRCNRLTTKPLLPSSPSSA